MLKSFHDLFLKFSVSPLAIHINEHSLSIWGFPRGSDGKESAYNAGDYPWVRKIYQRKEWLTTPVFLPGEIQGQRSLAGPSPWGHKELDTTE